MAGDAELPGWVEMYEAGLAAYANRNWPEAIELFAATVAARGGIDRASEILRERCRECLANPPPEDWMPISVLESKT